MREFLVFADAPSQTDILASFLNSPLPMVLFLFIIFYFLLVRPQQRKQKEHADMIAKLEKNDQVITAGGLHATVVSVGEKTATLRISDNVRVEIEKSSIQQVTKSRQGS